jgi:hypothetical protein
MRQMKGPYLAQHRSGLSAEERQALGQIETPPEASEEEMDAFARSRVKVRLADLKPAKAKK